ncbi:MULTISPECIES: MarR family winged helix-turn-helix transcriptional regulator [unclassified Viridibacillus]|uniref:MarR family winged helix-turn-helix transcriptional regulator n=1 Tax=unclassified Viridibacillus TaxID=2617942 RepID=UPI00096C0511|nr:MarR family transcriptional regulator [Viridibacillus sp. FSL H8-0123]OMC82012.1 MarR family transcriptional regulator [Viridibacillus sp. FSL H8-0123]
MMQINNNLKALTVLLRASQSVQDVVRKDMQQYGLNQTEFAVLELLYHKGEQPIQHIGKKILIASSSITYVVDKLEKKELVHRRACPDDRRVTYATITELGKVFMDNTFPKHEKKVNAIFEELSDQELEIFIDLLKRVGIHAKDI